MVPAKKLVFRPSAYAVIVNGDKILMMNTRSNGKNFFPGGGVDLGETIPNALKRELKEETGIDIKVQKFLHFKEQFFYYDPADEAYHMFNFFYQCRALSFDLLSDEDVDDQEAEKPRWLDLNEVRQNSDNLEAVTEVLRLI